MSWGCSAHEDFSFLTKTRFLNPRSGLGAGFNATLEWRSGEISTAQLDGAPNALEPETVAYLPQNYLEKICTELRDSSGQTHFDREVEGVIFSHVNRADRLGYATLRELLAYRASEKEARIGQLQKRLEEVNRQIVALQRRMTDEFKLQLEAKRGHRQAELTAHANARPAEQDQPEQDSAAQDEAARIRSELESAVGEIQSLDVRLTEIEQQREAVSRKIAAIERLQTRIENLRAFLETFYEDSAGDVALLDFALREHVRLEVDTSALTAQLAELATARADLVADANPRTDESTAARRAAASARAGALRARLDEPNRRYQEYLHRLEQWKQRDDEIRGSADQPESLLGLEEQLRALDDQPAAFEERREARAQLVREIFAIKQQMLEDFRSLYAPVQEFIEEHPVWRETGALRFSASIALKGLVEGFLSYIHQGRRGSFQGEQDGRAYLQSLIEQHDFSTAEDVLAFVDELIDGLTHDKRTPNETPVKLTEQLLQRATPEELYNYVFGLDYLQPRFALLWREKALDQLSPGERGTLLLVFYLLIDRRDIPLIIDQPEENLDNETVAELLVPAIKYAKERRQVIVVTHNPNLAVVCDADQVIHSSIDKANGNRITYRPGSIENPRIAKVLVNVLEGTKPAFDLRDAKYDVLERTA